MDQVTLVSAALPTVAVNAWVPEAIIAAVLGLTATVGKGFGAAVVPPPQAGNKARTAHSAAAGKTWIFKPDSACLPRRTSGGVTSLIVPGRSRSAQGASMPRGAHLPASPAAHLPASAGRRVQGDGGADQGLERLLVDLLALVEVDGAPRVALEAGIEEAGRILQRGPLEEGHLHHVLVGLTGADQRAVRPHR